MTRIRRGLVVSVALSYAAGIAAAQGTCFDGRCRDSSTYVSIMGLGCEGHGLFDCAMFSEMGFTRQQVDELIESCPCSCGVACSDKPATSSPTERPSLAPVSPSPTRTPTIAPTSRPSSAPITASPTEKPSRAPVTPNPSHQPSKAPQSPRPTPVPTSSPVTQSPTSGPTSSPVKMSTTTRIRPSELTGEGKCPIGFSGLTPTPDCKGAIHCSNGVKIFGPIPCLTGSTGSLVFDYTKKLCVLKTDDFVCEHPEDVLPDEVEATAVPTTAPTLSPSRLPTRTPTRSPTTSPTRSPSQSPVSPSPTSRPSLAPVSASPTLLPTSVPITMTPTPQPSNAVVAAVVPSPSQTTPTENTGPHVAVPTSTPPTPSPTQSELIIDLITGSNENKEDAPPDEDIEQDKDPAFVAEERSFWNTSISQSSGITEMFTPLVIGVIAGVGVLIIVAAAAMFALGQRMRQKRISEPKVHLKPGGKIQIDNLDDVVTRSEKMGEDEGIAGQILSAIFGSGVNENATMGPDGGGSTIITGVSLHSASSKMNSIIENSKASTQKVIETIGSAGQKSFESTQKQVKKIQEEVQKVAEDPAKAVQDATDITVQDVNNCGDRMFNCAGALLCLPNDVHPRPRSSIPRNHESSTKRQKNLREAFFDPDEDLSEISSVYEDV